MVYVHTLDLEATHQPFSRSLLGKSRSLFSLSVLSGEKGAWLWSIRYLLAWAHSQPAHRFSHTQRMGGVSLAKSFCRLAWQFFGRCQKSPGKDFSAP